MAEINPEIAKMIDRLDESPSMDEAVCLINSLLRKLGEQAEANTTRINDLYDIVAGNERK